MPTQTEEEISLWNDWLHTDDGSRYEATWDDDGNRELAERGKSWVAGRIAERRACEAEIARVIAEMAESRSMRCPTCGMRRIPILKA